MTDTVAAKTSTYLYDGLGRRVRDTVNGLSKHSHYLQNGQLSMVGDSRTNKVSEYVYLGGSLIAIRDRDVTTNVYTTKYQHTDALGTPIATTGSTGAFIEKSEYEPYGQQVNVVGAAKDGPGYTGHVQDAATGLVQMQQRYYDPLLGRFLSVDPVTVSSVNFNRYWYAKNNPYKFLDPDGRAPRNKNESPNNGGLKCNSVSSCQRERIREKNKQKKEKEERRLIAEARELPGAGARNSNVLVREWSLSEPSKEGGYIVQEMNVGGSGKLAAPNSQRRR